MMEDESLTIDPTTIVSVRARLTRIQLLLAKCSDNVTSKLTSSTAAASEMAEPGADVFIPPRVLAHRASRESLEAQRAKLISTPPAPTRSVDPEDPAGAHEQQVSRANEMLEARVKSLTEENERLEATLKQERKKFREDFTKFAQQLEKVKQHMPARRDGSVDQ